MSEPFYIAQTAEAYTKELANTFIRERAKEAKNEGAQLIRASIHPDFPNMLLIEGWAERHVGDQGHPRWAFATTKEQGHGRNG